MHLRESWIQRFEVSDLLVCNPRPLVELLIGFFKIVTCFVILTLKLDVDPPLIVDEQISEELIHFFGSDFLKRALEERGNVLDA